MVKKVLLLLGKFQDGENVSEYCKHLSNYLSSKDIEVHIISFDSYTADDTRGNISFHKITLDLNVDNIFNWAMMMNNEIKGKSRELLETNGFDLIHGNDWITAPAAMTIAKLSEKPLVMTIHSTEHERGFGIKHSGMISDMEWWSTYEASYVIVNNGKTQALVKEHFKVPEKKLSLIDPLSENWQEKVLSIYNTVVK